VAITILLAIMTGVLIYIAVQMRNNKRIGAVGIVETIDEAVTRFDGAIRHHTEVNAVIALTEAVGRHPELIDNLQAYSHDVVAAALINRLNSLGNDYAETLSNLSERRRRQSQSPTTFGAQDVVRLENEAIRLEQQMMEANNAVMAFTRLQPVR